MKPYVSSDCVEVLFENILNQYEIVDELYVVEVVVNMDLNRLQVDRVQGRKTLL